VQKKQPTLNRFDHNPEVVQKKKRKIGGKKERKMGNGKSPTRLQQEERVG